MIQDVISHKRNMGNDIKTLSGKYSGERAFLVGNGPSLDDTPLEKLTDEHTFATNRISKIYPDTDWRAKYYINTRKSINNTSLRFANEAIANADTSIVASDNQDLFPDSENIYYVNRIQVHDKKYECLNDPSVPEERKQLWSDDLSDIIYWYNTSIYPMYQVANYMGFDEIYLLGCDLGMDSTDHLIFEDATDPFLFWDRHKNKDKLTIYSKFLSESDKKFKSLTNGLYFKGCQSLSSIIPELHPGKDAHFGEEYLARPKVRRGTDDKQRRAHRLAKNKLEKRNVIVKNATAGGLLEIFPRVDVEEIL